jgi:hypothetical protein
MAPYGKKKVSGHHPIFFGKSINNEPKGKQDKK